VWEEIWKHSAGEEKLFYQGIIQAAAAMVHVQRGNPIGAESMYQKALAKLDPLPARHMGIALAELLSAMREFFARAIDDRAAFPKIRRLCRVGH
jgi:predicted metal-dependent hydrolase